MAVRENFKMKAPYVKSAVDTFKKKYSEDNPKSPEQIHLTEMGVNFLEIDWQLVKQAKAYITGVGRSNTPFKSVKECVDALRYVQENVKAILGQENVRKDAWDNTKEVEGGDIIVSAETILNELNSTEEHELVNQLEERIIKGEV